MPQPRVPNPNPPQFTLGGCYAVVGSPIHHSLSPQIHHLFAKQFDITIQYDRLLIPINQFESAIKNLQQAGLCGINITAPFKKNAYFLADHLSESALEANAVNTMTFQEDGKIVGDNTDGIGLIKDLVNNLKFNVQAKKILILGAGGAAQGIIGPLLREKPASVTVVNRDNEKAKQLTEKFAHLGPIKNAPWISINNTNYDLIINATSATSHQDLLLPEQLFQSKPFCYELAYDRITSFIQSAQTFGAPWANGLGMLIEQAAAAFYIWHGVKPSVSPIFAIIKLQISTNAISC